jgi:hypothetical protein
VVVVIAALSALVRAAPVVQWWTVTRVDEDTGREAYLASYLLRVDRDPELDAIPGARDSTDVDGMWRQQWRLANEDTWPLTTQCGNFGAARFELPIGSYSGDGLISIKRTQAAGNPYPDYAQYSIELGTRGNRGGPVGGWNFEPGRLL